MDLWRWSVWQPSLDHVDRHGDDWPCLVASRENDRGCIRGGIVKNPMFDREMDTFGRICPNIQSPLLYNKGQEGVIDTEIDSISLSCTRFRHEDVGLTDECLRNTDTLPHDFL